MVGKYAIYLPLTSVTPLFHRCGGPPSPQGKVLRIERRYLL
nr:MAG TPA: hypothetical protein [Caudoviricetes sp.]